MFPTHTQAMMHLGGQAFSIARQTGIYTGLHRLLISFHRLLLADDRAGFGTKSLLAIQPGVHDIDFCLLGADDLLRQFTRLRVVAMLDFDLCH